MKVIDYKENDPPGYDTVTVKTFWGRRTAYHKRSDTLCFFYWADSGAATPGMNVERALEVYHYNKASESLK